MEDRAVLLAFDDLWANVESELGFVPELKKMLRGAPQERIVDFNARPDNYSGSLKFTSEFPVC